MDDKWKGRYERWGVPLPESKSHGSDEDIRSKLKPLKAKKWWMEGNKLIAETSEGRFAQFLPTDVICEGVDKNGMPKLTRIRT